jgi:hypothetical protein
MFNSYQWAGGDGVKGEDCGTMLTSNNGKWNDNACVPSDTIASPQFTFCEKLATSKSGVHPKCRFYANFFFLPFCYHLEHKLLKV